MFTQLMNGYYFILSSNSSNDSIDDRAIDYYGSPDDNSEILSIIISNKPQEEYVGVIKVLMDRRNADFYSKPVTSVFTTKENVKN